MKYILFKGSMNPKSPMEATDSKLKELSDIGYKQGKDYDVVSLKVLEDMLGKAGGGIMDINQMTRPIHMAGGGDTELKGLLQALTIQLMLEKGMEGSTLMPSGNPDTIKRLEDRIQEIKIELGE